MSVNLSEYGSFDGLGLARLNKDGKPRASELASIATIAVELLNPELNAIVDDSIQ